MEKAEISIEGRVHQGHNIRKIRREKGLKYPDLAKLVGFTIPELIKIEGEKELDDDTISKFADALGVPFEEILEKEEKQPQVTFENNTYYEDNTFEGSSVQATPQSGNTDNQQNNPQFNGYSEAFMKEYQAGMRKVVELQEHFDEQLKERSKILEDLVDMLKDQVKAQAEQIKIQNEQINDLLQTLKKKS